MQIRRRRESGQDFTLAWTSSNYNGAVNCVTRREGERGQVEKPKALSCGRKAMLSKVDLSTDIFEKVKARAKEEHS